MSSATDTMSNDGRDHSLLQPYPYYRFSGVHCFSKVPAHWDVARLKSLCNGHSQYGANVPATEYRNNGIRLLRTTDITEDGSLTGEGVHLPAQIVEGHILTDGDILLSRSGTVGRSFLYQSTSHGPCAYAGYLVRFVPKNLVTGRYICYFTKTTAFEEFLRTSAISSTIENVNAEKYANCRLPLPPPAEQATIVRYLDNANELINRYISAKERLIALLEEQRRAVIQQAVTRGLDPNVQLKPSGVDWLGDIPRHWEISRVKNEFISLNHRRIPLSAVERGSMTLHQYDYYGASGIIDKVDEYIFDDELLLIAEDGANLVLRNLPLAVIARGKFWVNNHAHILKPRLGNLEFLAGLMEGINYAPWISGAAQPKLTQDRLMSIAIALPSKAEQDEIVQHVHQATAGTAAGIARAQQEVGLMNEYRTRLIADVVTGQVDVRKMPVKCTMGQGNTLSHEQPEVLT